MKKSFVLAAALMAIAASATELRLECQKPGSWQLKLDRISSGEVEEFSVKLQSPAPAVPPCFTVAFEAPQTDMPYKWVPDYMGRAEMPPNWRCQKVSRLSQGLPLVVFLNGEDQNRLCVAMSEAKRTVQMSSGLREEDCLIVNKLMFFSEPEAPISEYEVKLRVDRRPVFFGAAIGEAVSWIERVQNLKPMIAPEAAFDPLYSAWYSFHQNVFDREIEAECAEAVKLGMKTLIVDDGWQTDDNNRGYAFTGDWEISPRRFPDMAAHVDRVHALGMKYMIWYGLPMMGIKAKNYARFKGKFLFDSSSPTGYAVLDPRFPEVRDYLCGIYERAVRDWHLDGLKLDFIDLFYFKGKDPAIAENYAGRDLKSVPEAVDRLLSDIHRRLTAIRPGLLIEFRQSYIGPVVRQYGNMIRAADCPGDFMANRCRIANLRLTSGASAVHADMLEWNAADSAESAARFVLSSIFSTIQYSMMLRTLPESHRRMIAHWLKFSQDHRQTLLKGEFRPHLYWANYPWIEAESAAERIVAVYAPEVMVKVDAAKKPCFVLDGAAGGSVLVDLKGAAKAEVFDTFGAKQGERQLPAGLNRIQLPRSGYLRINF